MRDPDWGPQPLGVPLRVPISHTNADQKAPKLHTVGVWRCVRLTAAAAAGFVLLLLQFALGGAHRRVGLLTSLHLCPRRGDSQIATKDTHAAVSVTVIDAATVPQSRHDARRLNSPYASRLRSHALSEQPARNGTKNTHADRHPDHSSVDAARSHPKTPTLCTGQGHTFEEHTAALF